MGSFPPLCAERLSKVTLTSLQGRATGHGDDRGASSSIKNSPICGLNSNRTNQVDALLGDALVLSGLTPSHGDFDFE